MQNKKDTSETFQLRAEAGKKVAAALIEAIHADPTINQEDKEEVATLAARIALCNAKDNLVEAPRVVDKHTGEILPLQTHLWRCNSKLCPDCLAKERRRNRRKIELAIAQQKLFIGESYNFITFTVPNLGLNLLATRALVSASWQLFRKRKWTKSVIIGYAKSEEFTLTRKGYHYHIHLLVRSKYIFFDRLRTEWTECVRAAYKAAGIDLKVSTADRLLIVNCQRVSSVTGAIKEVCKYITKSDSWRKISKKELLQVALITRWHRMFELGGTFAERNRNKAPLPSTTDELNFFKEPDASSVINKIILDNKNLSDGGRPSSTESWRKQLHTLGLKAYALKLTAQIKSTQERRCKDLAERYEGVEQHLPRIQTTAEALAFAQKLAIAIFKEVHNRTG